MLEHEESEPIVSTHASDERSIPPAPTHPDPGATARVYALAHRGETCVEDILIIGVRSPHIRNLWRRMEMVNKRGPQTASRHDPGTNGYMAHTNVLSSWLVWITLGAGARDRG